MDFMEQVGALCRMWGHNQNVVLFLTGLEMDTFHLRTLTCLDLVKKDDLGVQTGRRSNAS